MESSREVENNIEKWKYQTIAAEGRAYLKNSPTPLNISMERGARVSEQAEEKHMIHPRIMAHSQFDKPIATAPPRKPSPDL